ncbi:hypothetical protein [Streptomyces sp. NPDC047000]|uniref:hypothetical protein n=1 Tax=Streptomyces sp. NPDC047000 TaxID=3155474 RepID=UPI00340EF078
MTTARTANVTARGPRDLVLTATPLTAAPLTATPPAAASPATTDAAPGRTPGTTPTNRTEER